MSRLGNISFQPVCPSSQRALATLREPVKSWLVEKFTRPTPAQRFACDIISSGANLLLAAPTGGGKTLAAILPIVSRMFASPQTNALSCLYIAPQKSLCNDINKEISSILQDLNVLSGCAVPLQVGLRTGDSSAHTRAKLIKQPPHFLISTPESLSLLLTHPRAGALFQHLRWIVVDEVHALAGNKRGADLSVSLERLQAIAAEPVQRIGLSATCAAHCDAAHFLAGVNRNCTIAVVKSESPLNVQIDSLTVAADATLQPQRYFHRLVKRLELEIVPHKTLLVFCGTRRFAERLTYALRRRLAGICDRIAVHHSALSQALRSRIEEKLKHGFLSVVVTSTSLELGIDVGAVDRVVLIDPPASAVQLLQRVGRSGHGPGKQRCGLVLTGSAGRLVEALVTLEASLSGQIERFRSPEHPLDVLCQQLLGMAALRAWSTQEAFAFVRNAYPYRNLPFDEFRDCLHYLSASERLPALPKPRLRWTNERFTLSGERSLRDLRQNIGVIPQHDSLNVADEHQENIGELDLSFADRLQPGDRFVLDGRCLELTSAAPNGLLVKEATKRPILPRWSGESVPLAREVAGRLYLFREMAAEALLAGPVNLRNALQAEFALPIDAAELVTGLFVRQEAVSEIPQASACLIEQVDNGHDSSFFVHTPLSRSGNDAIARVLEFRLRQVGFATERVRVANLGFLIVTSSLRQPDLWQFRRAMSADGFQAHLRLILTASLLLERRFQHVARNALLVPKRPMSGRRFSLFQQLRARRLLESLTLADESFVLLRQARREILEDCFDVDQAARYLNELRSKSIRLRRLSCISPLAEAWT